MGFSVTVDYRLRVHRTSAPYAALVQTWACKPLWEQTAIECVTQGCERLSPEVFRGDLADVQARAERFFETMPKVDR